MEKLEQEIIKFNEYNEKREKVRAEKARQKKIEAQRKVRETWVITSKTRKTRRSHEPKGVSQQIEDHFSNLRRRLGLINPGTGKYYPQAGPGVINPGTGEYYPQAGPGVINPGTGEYYPQAGPGFINPRTGEYFPGIP